MIDNTTKKTVLILLANANNITISEYIKRIPTDKKNDVLTLCKALKITPVNIDNIIK